MLLARERIRAAQRTGDHDSPPDFSVAVPDADSQWTLLRREIDKRARQLPLRELLARAPTAVMRLAPCVLASPRAVAQFLPDELAPFDLVVFDEASRIASYDALDAIARGRQVIVVGDPEQLAPFDDGSAESAPTSILDDCRAANLPTLHLGWHYRSRAASLFAFPNRQSYGGRLASFPGPDRAARALHHHTVPGGRFNAGAAQRNNAPEAVALVRRLCDELRLAAVAALADAATATGRRVGQGAADVPRLVSFGVIAFTAGQQRLIEDLLDAERRNDPTLEPFFRDDQPEPLFVKLADDAQGDERDVIYLSTTFAPGADASAPADFGALAAHDGARRLNVAITRARAALHVVTSLRDDDLDRLPDGNPPSDDGVDALKAFVRFARDEAQRGFIGDEESAARSGDGDANAGNRAASFPALVARALEARGWRVSAGVGAATGRPDLAVIDPDRPGHCLAGIDCGAPADGSALTARDRDKLRADVLRGLGWELLRTSPLDWWRSRDDALAQIDQALSVLLTRQRRAIGGALAIAATSAATATSAIARSIAAEADRNLRAGRPDDDGAARDRSAPADSGAGNRLAARVFDADMPVAPSAPIVESRALAVDPDAAAMRAISVAGSSDNDSQPAVFHEASPASAVASVDPDLFFDDGYDATLVAMIRHVVEIEGPVREDVVSRRIARAHGWTSGGGRIHDRVHALLRNLYPVSIEGPNVFIWPAGGGVRQFRRPGVLRPIDEIALAELAALAREIDAEGHGASRVIDEMASRCGLLRTRESSRARLEQAWAARRG